MASFLFLHETPAVKPNNGWRRRRGGEEDAAIVLLESAFRGRGGDGSFLFLQAGTTQGCCKKLQGLRQGGPAQLEGTQPLVLL